MSENETDNPIRDVAIIPDAPSAIAAREALTTYQEIQKVFDEKMPDAIMEIRGKKFRKKSYWRAIATAFHVDCTVVGVERIEADGDWGYTAVARATAPDGRTSDGDGACMASEKTDRDGRPTSMRTVHNIRSHAITRAKNRAISDLVGFGEVSADELGPDTYNEPPQQPPATTQRKGGSGDATEKQLKMLGAKAYAKAAELMEIAEGESIALAEEFGTQSQVKDEIARLAKERVGCAEIISKKEIDPLVIAIGAAQVTNQGTFQIIPSASNDG